MNYIFKDKTILVTGCCGTVGNELIYQLLNDNKYKPKEVIGLDNNETGIFYLDQKYINFRKARFIFGDVRKQNELIQKFHGVDIVFHTAALKHVILSERSPDEVVDTNILGVQNIIIAANVNKIEKVIFTSSDKAVNPTNVMGTSKLMGERLISAANSGKREIRPIFASTRFGNVLGSSGSVVPIFYNQIKEGGPVTLTNKFMSRFIMNIKEAVSLVINSAIKAKGGEVFITKMPVIRIEDLAKSMIEVLAPKFGFAPKKIKIIEIGEQPGEKLYEELMSDEESRRALELKDFFIILPAFRGIYQNIKYTYRDVVNLKIKKAYSSQNEKPLNFNDIKKFLIKNDLVETPEKFMLNRYWIGDKRQKF